MERAVEVHSTTFENLQLSTVEWIEGITLKDPIDDTEIVCTCWATLPAITSHEEVAIPQFLSLRVASTWTSCKFLQVWGGELGILSTQRSIDRNSKPLMIVSD